MLTQAAPGSLRKTPYEAAAAPAFPHSRFTTPSPAGLPGALLCSTEVVVPHRQQPHLLVLAWPRAAERTTVQELFVRAVALGLGGAGWLAGSGQSRKTGARAGSGCREERQAACSAALQGGTARLQQQPRPSRPRSAPSSHAGSGHSTNPPAPLRTKASRGFIRLCGGNSAQEFVRRRTFPPAQRVTGDPEPSVSQPWPAQIQPRTEHSVPQRVGSSKERPGLQSPSAV